MPNTWKQWTLTPEELRRQSTNLSYFEERCLRRSSFQPIEKLWKSLTDQDTPLPPEAVWIKTDIKKNELTQPEILTADEAKEMISAATRIRDKAFIAVGHDGGFRVGEMLGIKIRGIEFDEQGARINVSGKTGGRVVTAIASAPLLAR